MVAIILTSVKVTVNVFRSVRGTFGNIKEPERGKRKMQKIAVMTDSNCGMLPDKGKKLGISIVPMPVIIDGTTYYEGVDITAEEFYKRQAAGAEITSSLPSPGDVMDMWEALLKEHDEVVYIPMTSGLSTSCHSACLLYTSFDDFLLIGVVGARLDHTLGNVSILLYLDSLGKKGIIIDDYSEMEIISNKPAYIEDSYAFFSLLNVTGTAKGITIENAKYPLENAEITCEYQYGISNEVLPGRRAKVTVLEGKLLLIKDRG